MAAPMDLTRPLPHAIQWNSKLRHLALVTAFGVGVAALLYAFQPRSGFLPGLAYSLFISVTCWVLIDIGRHAFPSAADTGWPRGWQGVLLVIGGLVLGSVAGSMAADALCTALGWYPPGHMATTGHWRNTALISAVAGTIASYFFYAQSRSSYLERKISEAQRHATEARLKLLETQLEPHMLFNTLANLRALIALDPARAQQMLDHMIAYLRATLDASRATTHPLQAEFDRLRDYLELMAIRMGPRLQYSLELPPELADVRVPTLLLQPLVENSIQHGLETKVEGGRISVRAAREGDRLLLQVRDTGAGDGSPASQGKGFGLAQVRERLVSLHGSRAGLDVRTTPHGADARIVLPIT
jgi:signal transduction histidine kinase